MGRRAAEVRLLAEWPDGEGEPTRFWLSDLPDDTPIPDLARLAKIRWRIEHDYRELKHGLDHFEGRSWNGWHRPRPTPCIGGRLNHVPPTWEGDQRSGVGAGTSSL